MTSRSRILLLIIGLILTHAATFSQMLVQDLGTDCTIKMLEKGSLLSQADLENTERSEPLKEWIPALSWPAMIADILLQHAMIDEPWKAGKAEEYQWISDNDWLYSIPFEVDETAGEAYLHFKGLDGIVDIYLNGVLVGSHSNMYVPLEIDVTGKLQAKNSLVLHFHSVFEQSGDERLEIKFVDGDPDRPVRRTSHNYYNYLGPWPYWSRVGVFDAIQIKRTGGHKLDEVYARSSLDGSLKNGTVKLTCSGSSSARNVVIKATLKDQRNRDVATYLQKEKVVSGRFTGALDLAVESPELWWPRGYGEQALYTLSTELIIEGERHQSVDRTLGFRHVAMRDTFHFEVNHVPVRLWGGAWVTPDLKTVVWNQEKAEKLIMLAENANFNAFRVWAEVECPDIQFYEMANEKGFLIWQDFTHLPIGDSAQDMKTCLAEGEFLLKKLMNHPSVLLWCGGNEQAMRYYRALRNIRSFKDPEEDSTTWEGLAVTDKLNAMVKELDPDRFFIPNSPYGGYDPNDPAHGSTHGYTHVCFVPGYDYLNFASEDTRIAAPLVQSLERFMDPEDLWPSDFDPAFHKGEVFPFPEQWMKYSSYTAWRKTGPMERFYDADDLTSLVHNMGMSSGLYFRDVVERQRRGRPASDTSGRRRCGGFLVWKYNDSWPQVYSAKVDYFLEPYHAYYTFKRAYEPVLLSFDLSYYITLWAVNDTRDPVKGTVTLKILNVENYYLSKEISKPVEIRPGQSEVVIDLYKEGIGRMTLNHVLYAELKDEHGNILTNSHQFIDTERWVTYPEARVEMEVEDGVLILTTDQYARTVYLSGEAEGNRFEWFFEDNYFDIFPGEVKRVRILGSHKSGVITAKPWYSPHKTTIRWENN